MAKSLMELYGPEVRALIVERLGGGAKLGYGELSQGWNGNDKQRALFRAVFRKMREEGLVEVATQNRYFLVVG